MGLDVIISSEEVLEVFYCADLSSFHTSKPETELEKSILQDCDQCIADVCSCRSCRSGSLIH